MDNRKSSERPKPDGVVSRGWLGTRSEFDHQPAGWRQRLFRASGASVVVHTVLLLLAIVAFSVSPERPEAHHVLPLNSELIVRFHVPGPGGGGGGNPAVAAAKP